MRRLPAKKSPFFCRTGSTGTWIWNTGTTPGAIVHCLAVRKRQVEQIVEVLAGQVPSLHVKRRHPDPL